MNIARFFRLIFNGSGERVLEEVSSENGETPESTWDNPLFTVDEDGALRGVIPGGIETPSPEALRYGLDRPVDVEAEVARLDQMWVGLEQRLRALWAARGYPEDKLILERGGPATAETVAAVERKLGLTRTPDLEVLLRFADGFTIHWEAPIGSDDYPMVQGSCYVPSLANIEGHEYGAFLKEGQQNLLDYHPLFKELNGRAFAVHLFNAEQMELAYLLEYEGRTIVGFTKDHTADNSSCFYLPLPTYLAWTIGSAASYYAMHAIGSSAPIDDIQMAQIDPEKIDLVDVATLADIPWNGREVFFRARAGRPVDGHWWGPRSTVW